MANFFDPDSGAFLTSLNITSGDRIRIGLWGGDENGNDLTMYTYDSNVVDWSEEDRPQQTPSTRYFTLTAFRAGYVQISALHSQTGMTWCSVQVNAATSVTMGGNCLCQDTNGTWNRYSTCLNSRDCRQTCIKILGSGFSDSKCVAG
jgi:hypothetical protein